MIPIYWSQKRIWDIFLPLMWTKIHCIYSVPVTPRVHSVQDVLSEPVADEVSPFSDGVLLIISLPHNLFSEDLI